MRGRAAIDSLTGPLRAYYGLTQADVADFIGTTRALVAQVDAVAGRNLPLAPLLRLTPLLLTLPPPHGTAPPQAPEAPEPLPNLSAWPPLPAGQAPAPAALGQRLATCRLEAALLARRLRPLEQRAQQAVRLLALLPRLPLPLPTGAVVPAHPHPERLARTLIYLESTARDTLSPDATAARYLLATRRAALLHEAAALMPAAAVGS